MEKRITTITLLISVLLLMGCNKSAQPAAESTSATTPPSSTTPPPVPTTYTSTDYPTTGGNAPMTVTTAALQNFVGITGHSLDTVNSVQVNVNLSNPQLSGSATMADLQTSRDFQGYITISYQNDGMVQNDPFYTGSDSHDTQFNLWYRDQSTGKWIFHAFSQDKWGGLVLVISGLSPSYSLGDGAGSDSWAGSIWYKNYSTQATFPQSPYEGCWLVSLGPYDCQSWVVNGTIEPWLSINPDSGYTELGTFQGLSVQQAFNLTSQ